MRYCQGEDFLLPNYEIFAFLDKAVDFLLINFTVFC